MVLRDFTLAACGGLCSALCVAQLFLLLVDVLVFDFRLRNTVNMQLEDLEWEDELTLCVFRASFSSVSSNAHCSDMYSLYRSHIGRQVGLISGLGLISTSPGFATTASISGGGGMSKFGPGFMCTCAPLNREMMG